MYIICTCLYCLMLNIWAMADNDFLVNYFMFKKTSRVVGISCNSIEDDLSLIKDLSKNSISASINKSNKQTGISAIACTNYWKIGVFLDTRCYNTQQISSIFYEASEYRMFGELHCWIILGSNLEDVLNLIDDRAFGLSTDLIVAVPSNSYKNQYQLYDVYNRCKERGGSLNVTFFGKWSAEQGLTVKLVQTKIVRRANLQRFTIRAALYKLTYRPAHMTLLEYVNDGIHTTRDAQTRFGFHIISHLAELYNFSLDIHETPPWLPGDAQGPLARAIINNMVDFTGNPLTLTSQRTYMFKFVHQDWPFRTCFIFRNPQPTNIKLQEILRPFTTSIWCLMVIFFVIKLMILITVLHFERFNTILIRVSISCLLTLGALCQQGTEVKMNRLSTRIAFLFILIYSLLMYNYYSASVVSARLDEPIFKINDSLSEFGKIKMKMASESMVYLEFLLKKPDWETKQFYNNHWLKIPEKERIIDPEQGMRLVKRGGFAYHTHPEVGYPFVDKLYNNREICELMEVHLARPIRTAFGVTMNSSFVEIARVGLTKINEVGLRHREYLRWSYKKPLCRKDILSASSVNIYEFAPHLLLLIIGITTALILCAIEILLFNRSIYIEMIVKLYSKYMFTPISFEY